MRFVIHSENHGEWSHDVLLPLIQKALPEATLVHDADHTRRPDLILRATHPCAGAWDEKDTTVPYMTFSGEPYDAAYRSGYPPLCAISTVDSGDARVVWIPYFLSHPVPILGDGMRRVCPATTPRRFAVYISSNCHAHRDGMFRALLEAHPDGCHARGSCCANAPRVGGDWTDLTTAYSEYAFALVMENTDRRGYITEKIINAYLGGAIPIYWGGGGVARRIFHPDSYLDMNDFPSPEACAAHAAALYRDSDRLRRAQEAPIFRSPAVEADFYSFLPGRETSARYAPILEAIRTIARPTS